MNAIIAQILPFLSQEHQQQVATAVDRAKQVTMTELNTIIGVSAMISLVLMADLGAAVGYHRRIADRGAVCARGILERIRGSPMICVRFSVKSIRGERRTPAGTPRWKPMHVRGIQKRTGRIRSWRIPNPPQYYSSTQFPPY